MRIYTYLCTFLVGSLLALPAAGQQSVVPVNPPEASVSASVSSPAVQGQDPNSTPPAQQPAAAPTWSVGPIDFSGTIDGYYSYNFNHPRPGLGNTGATNVLYNFNIPTQQFSLNLVKLGLSHTPDPVGFEFDLAYGDTMQQINPSGTGTLFDQIVEQAYVSFKPAKLKGFEIDAGKFVTSAGAEVIESYSNWNYSRSLLFSWATPYYHFGLRTSMPLGKHWTGGLQLINGWNNTLDNNTAASIGATLLGTYGKFIWATNWYGGPENTGTNAGWRELFDSTITVTPSPVVAFYVNYDYAWQHTYNNFTSSEFCYLCAFPNGSRENWDGIAGAIHITPMGSKWAFSGRYEWFSDPQGFALANANPASDGDEVFTKNHVQEFTLTAEYKFLEGLMWRGEYRYDWSNNPIFSLNGAPDPSDSLAFTSKHQQTLTFAAIAYFGPKR